jgi:hypothetical protein
VRLPETCPRLRVSLQAWHLQGIVSSRVHRAQGADQTGRHHLYLRCILLHHARVLLSALAWSQTFTNRALGFDASPSSRAKAYCARISRDDPGPIQLLDTARPAARGQVALLALFASTTSWYESVLRA